MTLLTDNVKQWLGREFSYTAPEEIGRASIRYFALAVGDENRLYIDDAYARNAGYEGVIAPPTFICETNQYAHRQPDADGYIGHSWDLPLDRCRMIRGGHQYEFFQPVTPTDRISVRWRLLDMSEHRSSRGGLMLIVIALAVFTNQHGQLLAHNRETLIFQPLADQEGATSPRPVSTSKESGTGSQPLLIGKQTSPSSTEKSPTPEVAPGALRLGMPTPVLERKLDLVRMIAYAGATWDWARLHYDPAYVAERGLPAPVIDGQMIGALLSEVLLDWLGPRAFIRELNFRLRAMVFAGDTVQCEGEVTGLTSAAEPCLVTVAQRVRVAERLVADGSAIVRLPV